MAARDVSQRVVLVTGAAGGLGAALCQRYAQAGARVVALDQDEQRLQALMHTLPADALAMGCDITDAAACADAIARTVAQCGGLDLLINNAGISQRSLLQDAAPVVIRRVMEVNYFGAMQMTHAALPHLRDRRGAVVAVSSVAGFAPLFGRTAYAASKHALHGFFDSLRTELQEAGVQVTLACPSFIATGIAQAALGGGGAAPARARIAAGGESTPQVIAERIFDGIARGDALVLPDRTSRLAWWIQKLLPRVYARTMTQRVRAEFAPLDS